MEEEVEEVMTIGLHLEIKNKNIVIVGSYNEFLRGFKDSFKDIDLVVTNFNEIPFKDYIEVHPNKRFYYDKKILLEVFKRRELPQYEIINGYKLATIEDMINFNQKFNYDKPKEIVKRLKLCQNLQL